MNMSKKGSARRWGVALAVAFGLVVSACGGSDGSSSGGAPTTTGASAPTGEPLKLMTVTTLNANGPTYENIAITARLAADYLNSKGGIQGRPVEVIVCDEQFDAAVAAACARQAVEEGVVSVVGSFTYFAEAIVPVIAASDITWFGACCAISPSELGSPHSFPMGNQPMYAVGAVKKAVEDGCVNINAVVAEGADAIFLPPMINAMKAYGREFKDILTPSPVSQDYSADIARATSGVDCMVVVKSETPFLTWNTAYEQAQTSVKQYGNQGNLNAVSAKGAERATDGNIIGGMYPDLSTPPWDDYRAALEANNIDQVANDFNSLGGMGTWAAYMGFAQIAETIDGEITAASFFAAASSTTALDLNGMVPVLDFTQEWTDGLPGYNRLFNRSVVFSQLSNGQVIPLDNNFTDVSDLALGKPQN
jgi:ABC-type branched-subunit amino acid transport system substrate-binding protein